MFPMRGRRPVHGYPQLADRMGRHQGLAIFRRFATLNAKTLLYMQAELAQLEIDLANLEEADAADADDRVRAFSKLPRELTALDENGEESPQWTKVLEIRTKLKEYHEHLLIHSQVCQIRRPDRHDFSTLSRWLDDPDYGAGFLDWPESDVYEDQEIEDSDLIVLNPRLDAENDAFSRWFTGRIVPFLHGFLYRFKKPVDPSSPHAEFEYRDKTLARITGNLSIVIASVLPSASIFALYYIKRSVIKIAFIMIFSAVFSAALAIFTAAKKVEIFAGTVALASVQVVFIGTSGGSAGGG